MQVPPAALGSGEQQSPSTSSTEPPKHELYGVKLILVALERST